jgi:hypothetical protein
MAIGNLAIVLSYSLLTQEEFRHIWQKGAAPVYAIGPRDLTAVHRRGKNALARLLGKFRR